MGNCCGKSSSSGGDAFAGPGRTLGSAPPATNNARATIPAAASKPSANVNANTPGRSLGGGAGGAEGPAENDAKSAAAAAAEARAKKTAAPGSLADNLLKQKAKSRNATLDEASFEARRQREIDDATKAQNYN